MFIINETWDDGKSYRVKRKDGGWNKKSFLHKAKDLLFGDGNDLANNAENNLGAIKGLTKSTNVTEEGYAVDATALAEINSNMVSKDYIIPVSHAFTKALSAGRQWVYFDYSAPDGYELIAVYGYVDYPTNVEIIGFYAPKYIAVNCIADGTYTFQVNIACIKKI